jgi:lipopolysaccharide assembly outer membrane protein LptD (OstA)
MKNSLTLALVLASIQVLAQQTSKLLVSFQLQPELTFHQNQYNSSVLLQQGGKATFNLGFASTVQYRFSKRFFGDIGLGYHSRRINTFAPFDQSALPPPQFNASKEGNHTRYVSYKTLQVPVNLGCVLTSGKKLTTFVQAGITANYLVAAKYNVGTERYDGTYAKGYWQGIGITTGLGADLRLTKKWALTNSITYALANPVKTDAFLGWNKPVTIPHNYVTLNIGVKMAL